MKTTLISSNATLLYKLFLPFFLTAFLGALCVAAWYDTEGGFMADILPKNVGNIIFTSIFLAWLWFAAAKLWSLRRVEADAEHIYVSDYWHTAKYGREDIVSVSERKRGWIPMATIHLRGKGRFGKDIRFIKGREATALLSPG
jgi:hypothetical protein